MGIINLPAFESTAVEQRAAPQENPAYAGLAALQQAKRAAFAVTAEAGQQMVGAAMSSQFNKAIMDYSQAQQQKLLELERNPVTSIDPRFNDMTPEEQLNPNLTDFNRWKTKYLAGQMEHVGLPAVARKFELWTQEKGLAETEGLTKFDIATARNTGRVQLATDLQKAVDAGDRSTVLDLIDGATGPLISEAEAIEAKNTRFADIVSRETYLKTLTMPVAPVDATTDEQGKPVPAQPSGLEFLADRNNLRYTNWDGKTETLALGEQENLIAKYKMHLQEVSKQRDTFYSDVHIRVDSLEKVDQALAMLRADRSLTGTQKYEWEKRFEADRLYFLSLGNLKDKTSSDAHDEWMKNNEDLIRGELAVFHSQHPNDVQGLQEILYRSYNRADRRVSGKFVEEMLGKYEEQDTGEYKLAVQKMQTAVNKLPAPQQYQYMAEFEKWYTDPANKVAPSDKEVQQAITNIMSGYLLKAVDSAFPSYVQRAQEGGFTGIVEPNMKALEGEAPLAVKWAQKFWPGRRIEFAFIDKTNEYGFGEGAAIMMDGENRAHAFKVEGKELKMFTYVQTRAGDFLWQEVSRPAKGGMSPAMPSLEAEEIRQAQAAGWQTAVAEGRTPEEFAASGVSKLNITQMQQLVDAINVPWLGVNLLPKIAAELSKSLGVPITAADLEYEARQRGFLR